MLFKPASRRSPGPSWLQLLREGAQDEQSWALDYPLKLSKQFGEVVYIKARKQFLITGAKSFEHILKTHHHRYQRDPFFYQNIMFPFFGDGLLTREGESWKNRRRLALPFYQQSAVQHYAPIVTDFAKRLVQSWQIHRPKTINLLAEMNYLNLRIISTLMCSGVFSEPILKKLEKHSQFCNWYCAHAPFQFGLKHLIDRFHFRWSLFQIDRFFLDLIQKYKNQDLQQENLLHSLLNTQDEITGKPLNNRQVLDELRTHLFTGHETTACTLSWMWHLLAKHPQYQEQLKAELDSVLQGRTPTWNDIPHLKMTQAIISETSRLYPAIWTVPRTNLEADTILDVAIPKGSTLLLHIYSLHRNPDYWENPSEFRPERFLEGSNLRHPFAYLPFGAGPHRCIGSHFAPMEMILLTAVIAQHFYFVHATKKPKVIPEPCISLRPGQALKMKPKPY